MPLSDEFPLIYYSVDVQPFMPRALAKAPTRLESSYEPRYHEPRSTRECHEPGRSLRAPLSLSSPSLQATRSATKSVRFLSLREISTFFFLCFFSSFFFCKVRFIKIPVVPGFRNFSMLFEKKHEFFARCNRDDETDNWPKRVEERVASCWKRGSQRGRTIERKDRKANERSHKLSLSGTRDEAFRPIGLAAIFDKAIRRTRKFPREQGEPSLTDPELSRYQLATISRRHGDLILEIYLPDKLKVFSAGVLETLVIH